jgi:hypothetical protein
MEIPESYGEKKETQTAQSKINHNLPVFNARFYRRASFLHLVQGAECSHKI